MDATIRTENLTKLYGQKCGVLGLNLEVCSGEIFGFIGPNGAGKTTTIRLLLDFIRPTRGHARVLGRDTRADSIDIRRRVGYLPGELALYENLTGHELLTYFANLRGGGDSRYIRILAERLDLDLTRPIRTLSKGNKQKVGLVQAFMHRPELLILDEPSSGLDPLVQQEFQNLVLEAKAEGRTVFLSSHVLTEVEDMADRVGIIREGQLVAVEAMHTLKAKAQRQLEIRFAEPVPPGAFRGLLGVRDLIVEDSTVRCSVQGTVDALIKVAARFEVVDIINHQPDLETIFLAYYREGEHHAA
jgi:ABC-2 type transport system ATP-binding protein